ncbi:MAG: hypothetical protein WCL14_08235 [Bacteroidota bacterium]
MYKIRRIYAKIQRFYIKSQEILYKIDKTYGMIQENSAKIHEMSAENYLKHTDILLLYRTISKEHVIINKKATRFWEDCILNDKRHFLNQNFASKH